MIHDELPYSKMNYYIEAQGNPEAVIDISENGEYDVKRYAKANVDVAGGVVSYDYKTLILNIEGGEVYTYGPHVYGVSNNILRTNAPAILSYSPVTYKQQYYSANGIASPVILWHSLPNGKITVTVTSGSAEIHYSEDHSMVTIAPISETATVTVSA